MSILPELILQQTLVRGMRLFREQPNLVDILFRNLQQMEVDAIRQYLRDSAIDIALNYPEEPLSLPSIVIILKSENESQAFLGELQQSYEDIQTLGGSPFLKDELLGSQTTIGSGSEATVWYQGNLLLEPTFAEGGTSNSLYAPYTITRLIDPYESEVYVVTLEGTGAGQRKQVNSITPSLVKGLVIIEISGTWDTNPDNTTLFKLVGPDDQTGLTGEPSRVYDSNDKIERLGQIYRAVYQLDINGHNQEVAIYLYNIVKALMIILRGQLLRNGVINGLQMAGSDLRPVAEYFPQLAYRRSLTLTFDYAFDVYMELFEAVASELNFIVSARESGTSDPEVEVFNTSFTVS